ncbi:MAG: serine/threonine protein kinase [Phycisphaerales bacterium]
MSADRDRFQRIESIFSELSAMPADDPGVIESRLIELTTDDPSIADEVRAMLEIDQSQNNLLDQPAIEIDPHSLDDESLPESIASYTPTRILGEGGMGIVYEATQRDTNRRVALKVIRTRSIQDKVRKRFQREAQILAKLNHPGIATIYESGTADDNRTPFVAMELVDGQPIHHFVRETAPTIEQRVQLIVQVARAVAYAHSIGIVHRDLKPGNILVTNDAEPKVLDFGIALDMQLDERTMITQTGQLLGTLQYMAPEQVDRTTNESSTRTDVYALGLIAFELLTGTSAHAGRDASMYELVRSIRDDDPQTLGTHDRALRGDLETIIAKALAREPARRYPDAGALADDLDRFLTNKPILARPPSTWYQLRKFSQRNPLLVGSVASIMLVLVVAIILIANALRVANNERAIARQEQRAQEITALFVTEDLFSSGNPDYGGDADITLLDAMRAASDTIPERFKGAPVAEASISATMGDQFRMMNDFERAEFQLTRSLELSKQLPDLPPETLAYRYINLIDLYTDIDDLDRALELVAELESFADSSPDLPDASRIDMLIQHASILYYQRDLESAARIFEQAVHVGETRAPDHPGNIDAIGALAMVYTNLARYDDAAPLHRRNIEMSRDTLGPDHPATLQSMDNYAIQLYKNDQPQQARELLEQVLEIRLQVFGTDHHKTNLTRALIGRTTFMAGDHAAAEPILLDAYDRLTQTLGEDHRYTLTCRSIIKLLYEDWDKPELAANYAPPAE